MGSNDGVGFQTVVRLAGWNETDCGMQIMLGHEAGAWRFDSSQGEGLELPESVGRDLARLFLLGARGEGVGPTDGWPLPPDRNWLIEGFGLSEVITIGQPDPAQWPVIQAAMVVYKVHQLLLGDAFEASRAVTVVVAADEDGGKLTIDAGWSKGGFVYRISGPEQGEIADVSQWPAEGLTTDLEAILPSLAGYMPVVVHPVAAWAILSAIEPLDTATTELEHHLWRAFALRAIASCAAEEVEVDEDAIPEEPPPFTTHLVSMVADAEGRYDVRLAVTYAAETRHYDFNICWEDGFMVETDDATHDATNAINGPQPPVTKVEPYRLYFTGLLLNEWIPRLLDCGLLRPFAPSAAELDALATAADMEKDDVHYDFYDDLFEEDELPPRFRALRDADVEDDGDDDDDEDDEDVGAEDDDVDEDDDDDEEDDDVGGEVEDEPDPASFFGLMSSPWKANDAYQWSVRERLVALAGFVEHMTLENIQALAATHTHTIIVAYFEKLAYDYGWVSPRADWTNWLQSPVAERMFETPELILTYDIDGLTSVVTMMVRRERFCENTLGRTVYNLAGFITTCAARLLAELDAGVPLTATLFDDVRRS